MAGNNKNDSTNDSKNSKGGNNPLASGAGNNNAQGGQEGDTIVGGEGNDVLIGKKGNDTLSGVAGLDVLEGDHGEDVLSGGADADLLDGGMGDDLVQGDDGDDILAGDKGSDILLGGAGNDVLLGDGKTKGNGKNWGKDNPGNGKNGNANAEWQDWATLNDGNSQAEPADDYLDGGSGNDRIFAGQGNDVGLYNVLENTGANDTYDGGSDIDKLKLELTLTEWLSPVFQTDLAAYLTFIANHTDPGTGEADSSVFTFNAFNLAASAWEELGTSVDGVDVNPEDEAVIAHDDAFATDEDSSISGNVLLDNGNGADEIPDFLRAVRLVSSTNSELTLNSDGSLSYDPGIYYQYLAEGEQAIDSFTYEVEDANGDISVGTVNITVTGTNDGPVAVADTGDTDADTVITLDVLANDTDVDTSDVLTVTSASSGSGGQVTIVDNKVVFDPRNAFNHLIKGELEDVTLSYNISDGNGGTDTSTVVVTVEGTNTPPEAVDDNASTTENSAGISVNVLVNDIDPDPGEVLALTSVTLTGGKGSFQFDDTNVSWQPDDYYYLLDVNTPAGQNLTLVKGSDREQGKDYQFAHTDYDFLAVGESATITLEYTVEDRFN
ncbi:MAG: Ig-like domain-containing protein, partial [Pseudohongiellaceae bacterium]